MTQDEIWNIVAAREIADKGVDTVANYRKITPYFSLDQLQDVINSRYSLTRPSYTLAYKRACEEELMERFLLGKKRMKL